MTVRIRTIAYIVLAGLALAGVGAALFVYFGIYNIAATRQHTQPVYQLLQYAMVRSISARAGEISVPDLSGAQRIRNGALHYRSHCLQCHGAPGVAPHALAYGMMPEPVNLAGTAREWTAAKIFWVIKHGIKMSGMPAWEYRMSEEEMWDITAFVKAMMTMSPGEYAALTKDMPDSPHHAAGTEQHKTADKAPLLPGGPPPAPPTDAAPVPPLASAPVLGTVKAGRRATAQYLCATCHVIPGVVGAHAHVGPPLKGIAHRRYIAGILQNNPENMVRWLRNPQHFDPLSAMPNLGVTEQDARDIAAFLYTLTDVE